MGSSERIMPLCGLSCKLRLARFSARLKFQDRPSMAISIMFESNVLLILVKQIIIPFNISVKFEIMYSENKVNYFFFKLVF